MAWTAVITPVSTMRAITEPTTAKPRRSDIEEIRPVMPAISRARSTWSTSALRSWVTWSLLSRPESIAPAKRSRVGTAMKSTSATVSDSHRMSAKTGADSGRAR